MPSVPATLPLGSHAEEVFPTLTADQIARVAAHGRVRQVQQGEVLVEAGERGARFFGVTSGQIEFARSSGLTEELVGGFQPGMFLGGANILSGRRGVGLGRGSEA